MKIGHKALHKDAENKGMNTISAELVFFYCPKIFEDIQYSKLKQKTPVKQIKKA